MSADLLVRVGELDCNQRRGVLGLFFGYTELEQEFISAELLRLQLVQAPPELFQPSPAHRPFLVAPPLAERQDIELIVLFQQLDLHALAHLLPRFGEEGFFQLAQAALRCSHPIANRGLGAAHRRQHILGWKAPIHDPNPLCFTLLFFDPIQEIGQRRLVGGVARQDLVGEGKALRCHDQGDNHRHAVKTLVARVAELALAIPGRVGREIGAGQVIEQNLEAHPEQILPTRTQIAEKQLLVGQQLVQTAI
ncbi:MAG: hypothetical protein WA970_10465, partial [Gammaproteobacteria bacterium]